MTNNRKNAPRVHDAKLTDQEVRIINFFRQSCIEEVQSDLLTFFRLIVLDFPDIEEYSQYRGKLYSVWEFINAIEPLDALQRDELANNPEKLHI